MPDIFVSPSEGQSKSQGTVIPKSTQNAPVTVLKKPGMFSAFNYMPDGVRFETQESHETIVLLLRRHWLTNLPWLLISGILLFFPIAAFPSLSSLIPTNISLNFLTFIVFVWYLLTFSYAFSQFLLWYFTVGIVTNVRIVDVDFINLLRKEVSATIISKVEDVTMRTGGFIPSLFNFGDVVVQTAAQEQVFEFIGVPSPARVVQTINEFMDHREELPKP
jgi:hypothetical protein